MEVDVKNFTIQNNFKINMKVLSILKFGFLGKFDIDIRSSSKYF